MIWENKYKISGGIKLSYYSFDLKETLLELLNDRDISYVEVTGDINGYQKIVNEIKRYLII